MEFSIKSGSPEKQRSACVVVGVFEPRKLTLAAEQLLLQSERVSQQLADANLAAVPGASAA